MGPCLQADVAGMFKPLDQDARDFVVLAPVCDIIWF